MSAKRFYDVLGPASGVVKTNLGARVVFRHFTQGRRGEPICVDDETLVLGLEYSADDTGVAVINRHGEILGESLRSQTMVHRQFGGIKPAAAQECHIENLPVVTEEALGKANRTLSDISAIAFTLGPGMPYSLDSGIKFCRELHKKSGKPLVPVHHLHAHALTSRLMPGTDIQFPFLVLLASGGNCIFAVAESVSSFKLLGDKTGGWSPGKAIDRTSFLLNLPKVPELEHLCPGAAMEAAARGGDPSRFSFAWGDHRLSRTCHTKFSPFYIRAHATLAKHTEDPNKPPSFYKDFAASFMATLFQYLMLKLEHAVVFAKHRYPDIKHFVASGGVAANLLLRRMMSEALDRQNVPWELIVPPPRLCTDNGVMIAWAGMEYLKAGVAPLHESETDGIRYHPRLDFGEDISSEYVAPLARRIRRHPLPCTISEESSDS